MEKEKVTIMIDHKFLNTVKEFCKVMGFSVISNERTVHIKKIETWDDLMKLVNLRLGQSLKEPIKSVEDFLDRMSVISASAYTVFLIMLLREVNHADEFKPEWDDFMKKSITNTPEWEIIKHNCLPLFSYAKDKQED